MIQIKINLQILNFSKRFIYFLFFFFQYRHEDIRDAILSLVHMFRDSTDKLERHEYRERQLGDQLKKTLSAIEKKQKTDETTTNQFLEVINQLKQKLENLENAISKVKKFIFH